MGDPRGFHSALVTHAERAPDIGPGMPLPACFRDDFGTLGGECVNAGLDRREAVEGVVGHSHTVTAVAMLEQTCNHGCMTNRPACDMTLIHARHGLMDVLATGDGRYENWSYAEPRTLEEWARIGWMAPANGVTNDEQ